MTMTIRIAGKMTDGTVRSKTLKEAFPFEQVPYPMQFGRDPEKMIKAFFTKIGVPVSVAIGALNAAGKTYASAITDKAQDVAVMAQAGGLHSLGDRLMPIIKMVQDLALPVGIVVASWGMIEMILGNIESGKHKMKWAIIGFCGMFLIPEVFFAIRDAFQGLGLNAGKL